MFKFASNQYFYAYLIVPILIILIVYTWRWRKNVLKSFADSNLHQFIFPEVSDAKIKLKIILQLLAISFLILALARPQSGAKLQEVKREGADIIVALDVSNSMLAEDLIPNRLERAKQNISTMVDDLKGDRIGLILFAGEAIMQLPITTDYNAARMFLRSTTTEAVSTQGTAIGAAINLAKKAFESSSKPEHTKVMIIISDGENHEDDPIKVAKEAVEDGIKIYTVGIGSIKGTPIPNFQRGKKVGFKTDKEGSTVLTKLDETTLIELASIGGGSYYRTSNTTNGLKEIKKEIDRLEKTEMEAKMFTEYEELFQYFVALALILLTIDFFVSKKKSKWLEKINLFSK
jgi:Ca-activated chloride channel homolog